MILEKMRPREPRTVVSLGLFLLVFANLSRWLLPRTGLLGPDAVDGLQGFLMGAAIATLLVGIWRGGRGMTPRAPRCP